MGLPDGWFSARPLDLERLRDRRLLDERFRDLLRERSFLRRERLRLRLRERDLLPSSSFSWLLDRERLLDLETDEASESSSRAILAVVAATASTRERVTAARRRRERRVDGVPVGQMHPRGATRHTPSTRRGEHGERTPHKDAWLTS